MAIISIIPKCNIAKIHMCEDICVLCLISILREVLGKERIITPWPL
jgi:hypothetical protein